MIKFSLPGYYQHPQIVFFFAHLQKEHPEVFIENRCIDSAYDLPAGLIWNGGRINIEFHTDPSNIWGMADEYRKTGIKLRHTCTNCLLEPIHFTDVLCNNWLKYNESYEDSVIVNNEQLGEYVKQHYPNYSIIWSTTRAQHDIDTVNTLSEKDMVVLDYTHNHDEEYLSALQHPENIEILCAEFCAPNCPTRQQHYIAVSKHQLWMPLTEEDDNFYCPRAHSDIPFYTYLTLSHAVTNEYVDELYEKYGIENFKLAGRRGAPLPVIEAICYYLIKPEYRDMVRQDAVGAL